MRREVRGALCQRKYKFEGIKFVSSGKLCDHIADGLGLPRDEVSWQVLVANPSFIVRHKGVIVFDRAFTDNGQFRIMEGTVE